MSKIIDLETSHVSVIKNLFNILKDMTDEVKLNFLVEERIDTSKKKRGEVTLEKCIKMFLANEDQTVFAYVTLNGSQFNKFELNHPKFSIGLDLQVFSTFIKAGEKTSNFNMFVDNCNEDTVIFRMESDNGNDINEWEQKIMDIDDSAIGLPNTLDFTFEVTIKTDIFKSICSQASPIADNIQILCTPKSIIFRTNNDNAGVKHNRTLLSNEDNDNVTISVVANEEKGNINHQIYEGVFNLRTLAILSKCTHMCSYVSLFLDNDKPMFLGFEVGALGEMLVAVSPVIV